MFVRRRPFVALALFVATSAPAKTAPYPNCEAMSVEAGRALAAEIIQCVQENIASGIAAAVTACFQPIVNCCSLSVLSSSGSAQLSSTVNGCMAPRVILACGGPNGFSATFSISSRPSTDPILNGNNEIEFSVTPCDETDLPPGNWRHYFGISVGDEPREPNLANGGSCMICHGHPGGRVTDACGEIPGVIGSVLQPVSRVRRSLKDAFLETCGCVFNNAQGTEEAARCRALSQLVLPPCTASDFQPLVQNQCGIRAGLNSDLDAILDRPYLEVNSSNRNRLLCEAVDNHCEQVKSQFLATLRTDLTSCQLTDALVSQAGTQCDSFCTIQGATAANQALVRDGCTFCSVNGCLNGGRNAWDDPPNPGPGPDPAGSPGPRR